MSAMRIMTMLCGRRLLADQRGDVLVGFVLIVGLLFSLFFAGVGFFLLLSWLQFTEMATQAGVRTAVVSTPAVAVASWPDAFKPTDKNNNKCADVECLIIPAKDGGAVGRSCMVYPGACETLPLLTCSVGTCDPTAFTHIADRMQQVFPLIKDENISIRYADSGLGYVGGPPVPLVTVVVSDLPIPIIGAIIDLAFRLVGGAAGDNATMRPIQASMTAEDLNTAGSP
jgi:hypothetical protein